MSREITLVRHAPTAHNSSAHYMGQLDPPVDSDGMEAALMAGKKDWALFTGLVLCSPLRRATASAAALFPAGQVQIDSRLQERGLGCWQGMSHAEAQAGWPEAFPTGSAIDPLFTPPDGEKFDDFVGRVADFLDDASRWGDVPLAVTHNGWIRTAMYLTGAISLQDIFREPVPHLQLVRLDLVGLTTTAPA